MDALQNPVGGAVERLVPGTIEWESLHADHVARYLHAATFACGKRILDAGTGLGYGAAILADSGAASVCAVDIDAAVIDEAKRQFVRLNIDFRVDDCQSLGSIADSFDIVCNFENIEHLAKPRDFLKRTTSILKDDGLLLCSSPDREHGSAPWVNGRPANPHHQTEWSRAEFGEMLNDYFEDVQILTQCRTTASRRRAEAVRILQQNINDVWYNPMVRIGRLLKRLGGNVSRKGSFKSLDALSPIDFPIVPHGISGLLGTAHCHYAVCRKPKRQS
jgi:SAM-dependent methyltransferase